MLKSNKVKSDYIPTLRDRVKALCMERGMKIGAVGQLIGKSPLFFNNVFRGKQNIYLEDIEHIADVLNTSSDYLLGISDNSTRRIAVFKERTKALCKTKGLSQKFVSESTGHGQFFLNDVWLGKRNLSDADLETIASTLSTTSEYLSGASDDPAPADSPIELSSIEKEMLELFRSLSLEDQELFKKIIERMKG